MHSSNLPGMCTNLNRTRIYTKGLSKPFETVPLPVLRLLHPRLINTDNCTTTVHSSHDQFSYKPSEGLLTTEPVGNRVDSPTGL